MMYNTSDKAQRDETFEKKLQISNLKWCDGTNKLIIYQKKTC